MSFLALQQLEYTVFFIHNWKYKVTVNMPFDKNIFTKKCTFLYNSIVSYTSLQAPQSLLKAAMIPTNCPCIVSALF